MDSKRLRVLKKLTNYLQSEVNPANGYDNDLSPTSEWPQTVFRGRMFFGDDDPTPMVSILENPDPDRFPPSAGRNGQRHPEQLNGWVLLVQGWAEDDKANPTDPAYSLMADVVKALARIAQRVDSRGVPPADYAQVYLLGEELTNFVIEPGVVRPPTEQVSDKAFFWLRVTLTMPEDPNDPFA